MKISKITYNFLMMVTLMVFCVTTIGCNSDNDTLSSENLQTYIIGKWQSHHLTAYTVDGRDISVDITKNNAYSSAYIEITFLQNGEVISEGWKDGSWIRDVDNYIVSGDHVVIKEKNSGWNEGMSFETTVGGNSFDTRANTNEITLVFDRKTNMLYLRETKIINGIQTTANLYFKKQ